MIQFSDKLESQKILELLSRGLPYYLKAWHTVDESSGYFGKLRPESFNMNDIKSSSPAIEYVIRPHLQVLCILASYIYRNNYGPLEPIATGDEIKKMVADGITWVCDTHLSGSRDIDSFLERRRWGENWRSSLWASLLALCTFETKAHLTSEIIRRVNEIVAFEADRFIDVLPPDGCTYDTKLDENASDTMILAWAINLIPDHEHIEQWEKALRIWSINIATTIYDKANHSDYFGSSVSQWILTETLYPDCTAENHGFYDPEILSYGAWIVLAMAAYSLHGNNPPQCLRRKNHQDTLELLLRFYLPNGLIYSPCGHDLPYFIPRPFALAWGLWNNDPRAMSITVKQLAWIDSKLTSNGNESVPWIPGFDPTYDGWELYFQSQVGFELSLLAILPFPKELRFYSSGQIESAVDTSKVYPFVEVCYRRNTRTSRSVSWRAFGNHPLVGIAIHTYPELIAQHKANLLGVPSVGGNIKNSVVAFHHETHIKDGFDSYGRIHYCDSDGTIFLHRDIRVLTWGDEGLVVFDEIVAQRDLVFDE